MTLLSPLLLEMLHADDLRPFIFPAALLAYYIISWLLVGRDPKIETVTPQYQPPPGVSPAVARYVLTGGSDGTTLAAVLARLAANQVVAIQPEGKAYRVKLLDGRQTVMPEEAAVVKQLGARLGLLDAEAVDKRYQELSAKLDALQPELDSADEELDHARSQLGAELLARWPVLGDSYHDEFASTLQRDSAAISGVLSDSRYAQRYKEARAQADALGGRANTLDAQEAVVLRLVRAYETAGLASALAARGGEDYRRYQALLACERGVP